MIENMKTQICLCCFVHKRQWPLMTTGKYRHFFRSEVNQHLPVQNINKQMQLSCTSDIHIILDLIIRVANVHRWSGLRQECRLKTRREDESTKFSRYTHGTLILYTKALPKPVSSWFCLYSYWLTFTQNWKWFVSTKIQIFRLYNGGIDFEKDLGKSEVSVH